MPAKVWTGSKAGFKLWPFKHRQESYSANCRCCWCLNGQNWMLPNCPFILGHSIFGSIHCCVFCMVENDEKQWKIIKKYMSPAYHDVKGTFCMIFECFSSFSTGRNMQHFITIDIVPVYECRTFLLRQHTNFGSHCFKQTMPTIT